eukprot:Gb_25477 [translate_table: standard]
MHYDSFVNKCIALLERGSKLSRRQVGNDCQWGNIKFPMPFGRVMSTAESAIHCMDEKVGDLGYANELGNYAEYSGAPNEDEVLQYARVLIDCATANPDGRKRALVIGGGIANFTDVAATFSGIIRALWEKNGLAKMPALGEEIGVPFEVYGPEASMTGICKQAIDYITASA